MTTPIEQAQALAAAERLAIETLGRLSADCRYNRILAGSTRRGPAFVDVCTHCASLAVVSVPAGGLRSRDPGDPTSRTRIASFALSWLLLETGAFIESDGTVRARFVIHLPGREEAEWDITADAAAVGEAVRALAAVPGAGAIPGVAPMHAPASSPVPRQAAPQS